MKKKEKKVEQSICIIIHEHVHVPLSEVDEVVWFTRDSVLLAVSNEHNPTQVHAYKTKGRQVDKVNEITACVLQMKLGGL